MSLPIFLLCVLAMTAEWLWEKSCRWMKGLSYASISR